MIQRIYWDDPEAIGRLQQSIQEESVFIGSSDTVIGLFAPISENGVELLNHIKKRSDRPYLILVGSKAKVAQFAHISLQIENLIDQCWPGPVTMIFKVRDDVPDYIKGPKNTVALRVPDHAGLQNLLTHFDGLFSTSANITGNPIPKSVDEVDENVIKNVSVIVADREEKVMQPSTILDCSGVGIMVIRAGAFSVEKLEKMYGESFKKKVD